MGALDFLFGSTDDSSQEATIQSNRERMKFIEDRANAARNDILKLFPAAQTSLAQGIGGALDVIRGSVPQQISAFEQGNRGAQDINLKGLGGFRDAILGNPMDFSPETLRSGVSAPLSINTSFLGGGIPQMFLSSDLNIPGTNGSFTPNTPINVTSDPNANTFNQISSLFKALSGQPPAPVAAPAPAAQSPNYGNFADIVSGFQGGNVDLGTGTKQVAAMQQQLGLTTEQVAQQLGLSPAEVLALYQQFGA